MRRTSTLLFALGLASALGCAGATRSGPLDPGRAQANPAMECLPDADVPDSSLSERMRFGLTLARESFLIPEPAPPDERTAGNLEVWSEEVLSPWLERKTHTVEAARHELDEAAEETHRQRIMSGAVVGLMYEDVARVLRAIPPPEELDDEPEIRDIYRNILRSQAGPFVEHARAAYSACAQNAVRPPGMRHWSHFCAARQGRLPARRGVRPGPASGETTVEIIAE